MFQETETPKKFFIFQETELSYIPGKEYSEPWHNGTFLSFGNRTFRTLAYLELEVCSEPWYFQNPRHIQNSLISFAKIARTFWT